MYRWVSQLFTPSAYMTFGSLLAYSTIKTRLDVVEGRGELVGINVVQGDCVTPSCKQHSPASADDAAANRHNNIR